VQGMSLCWLLGGRGWADCTVADNRTEAEVTASYITAAAEDLLTAVTRIVLGETEAWVQFEAEPTAFRWRFHRGGDEVWIQLLQLPDGRLNDKAGAEIWSSLQTVDSLTRAVIRCFDEVKHQYSESGYQDTWGSPFPRQELEKLRTIWKAR
jgi:hypothetical protein